MPGGGSNVCGVGSVGTVEQLAELATLADSVRDLVKRSAQADGADPLDEAQLFALDAAASDGLTHLLAYNVRGDLVGYAQISWIDSAGDATAVVAVDGDGPRDAVAEAMLVSAETLSAPGRLLVWGRSDASPVGPTARRRGYTQDRVLRTMSRPLDGIDTSAPTPVGIKIRPFVAGADDNAWLAVNAGAFAHHPEQGAWTVADLTVRVAQPWFDPAGFLLAVDDATNEMLGFHWTKLHDGSPPVGEVYVIATAPQVQGRGVGKALLAAGLQYLRASGAHDVILYVDESNAVALRLYEGKAFTTIRRQVQYRRP